ncbi:hypothetical protein [Ktedonobacter racemifer]|uniref:hypothetical protein n=1 Tax=Ktedonobacter racemifer TaxID=363277 RepID=UPI0005909FF8|nr:hypothetical protein [Ktedonobacter racemifer]
MQDHAKAIKTAKIVLFELMMLASYTIFGVTLQQGTMHSINFLILALFVITQELVVHGGLLFFMIREHKKQSAKREKTNQPTM